MQREAIGDPRPEPRVVDPDAGTKKILSEERCRACGGHLFLNRAHLVARGQRGDDVDDNIVPLCGSGTSGCHGSLTDHHAATFPSLLKGEPWEVVASALREKLSEQELSYVLVKKGQDWLDKTYPRI